VNAPSGSADVTTQVSPFFTQPLSPVHSSRRSFRRVTTLSPTPCGAAVGQRRGADFGSAGVSLICLSQCVELPDELLVDRQHDAVAAAIGVGRPRGDGCLDHLAVGAVENPIVVDVGVNGLGITVAQSEGGLRLPRLDEAANAGQLGDIGSIVGEHMEGAAGFDGAELRPVADDQDLGSRRAGAGDDRSESERAGQAGFIDEDHQLIRLDGPPSQFVRRGLELSDEPSGANGSRTRARVERSLKLGDPPLAVGVVVLFGQPLRGVVGRDLELVTQHLRGGRGRREAHDALRTVIRLPRILQRGQGGCLAAAGRPDEQIQRPTGRADGGDRVGLIVGERRGLLVDSFSRDRRAGQVARGIEESSLGVEDGRGGVAAGPAVTAPPP
jgi:hypothetical protein